MRFEVRGERHEDTTEVSNPNHQPCCRGLLCRIHPALGDEEPLDRATGQVEGHREALQCHRGSGAATTAVGGGVGCGVSLAIVER